MLVRDSDAAPEATGAVPSEVAPSKNDTVPAAPAPATVAVSVREAGATAVAVAGLIASVVVVVTAAGAPGTVIVYWMPLAWPSGSVPPWLV